MGTAACGGKALMGSLGCWTHGNCPTLVPTTERTEHHPLRQGAQRKNPSAVTGQEAGTQLCAGWVPGAQDTRHHCPSLNTESTRKRLWFQ